MSNSNFLSSIQMVQKCSIMFDFVGLLFHLTSGQNYPCKNVSCSSVRLNWSPAHVTSNFSMSRSMQETHRHILQKWTLGHFYVKLRLGLAQALLCTVLQKFSKCEVCKCCMVWEFYNLTATQILLEIKFW